jgi:predicted ribosome-associated RNA-binding protein Tma20
MMHGRMKEANRLVHKAAKSNKIKLSGELEVKLEKLEAEANINLVNNSMC